MDVREDWRDVTLINMALPQATIDFAHRMFDAARNGDSDTLVAAIKAGLPVNMTNSDGNTLLMLAAYAGHTALSIIAGAVFKDFSEVVKVLMEGGADPRLGKPSAVETAVMFGRKDIMSTLGANESEVGTEVPRPVGDAR
ncbi:hypothetical protein CPB85DRAFT_439394 [Mucidula mucida]|nr:hypothetical protein CPB85DRAFT_439394 [Mucidula mucida]